MRAIIHLTLLSLVFVLALVSCAPASLTTPTAPVPAATLPVTSTVTPTEKPLPTATPAPTATPTPTENIYTDQSAGFELTYPLSWTLDPNKPIGSRASQALLLSPGTTAETLADGGSRVAIVVYKWDPKNDLDAYLAMRKSAWEASGSKIVEETELKLTGERRAVSLVVQSTDNQQDFILLTTVGEDYLQIVGTGDLVLTRQIALTLSPAKK